MSLDRAPRLESNRLVLRAHETRDYEAFAQMWTDPLVLQYTIVEPRSAQDAWMTMHRLLGSWPLLGYGYWGLELKSTQTYVGDAGFMDAMRPSTPDKRGIPEIGYALASPYHGQGLMSEALDAIHRWWDEELPGTETFALIDDDNPGSVCVAKKCGYAFERRADTDDRQSGLYTRKPLSFAQTAD
ncbi:MAG: GNAT family N-acetyltransferase [Pseudomonadota bacterium]